MTAASWTQRIRLSARTFHVTASSMPNLSCASFPVPAVQPAAARFLGSEYAPGHLAPLVPDMIEPGFGLAPEPLAGVAPVAAVLPALSLLDVGVHARARDGLAVGVRVVPPVGAEPQAGETAPGFLDFSRSGRSMLVPAALPGVGAHGRTICSLTTAKTRHFECGFVRATDSLPVFLYGFALSPCLSVLMPVLSVAAPASPTSARSMRVWRSRPPCLRATPCRDPRAPSRSSYCRERTSPDPGPTTPRRSRL